MNAIPRLHEVSDVFVYLGGYRGTQSINSDERHNRIYQGVRRLKSALCGLCCDSAYVSLTDFSQKLLRKKIIGHADAGSALFGFLLDHPGRFVYFTPSGREKTVFTAPKYSLEGSSKLELGLLFL
jgi:hypothetical protein